MSTPENPESPSGGTTKGETTNTTTTTTTTTTTSPTSPTSPATAQSGDGIFDNRRTRILVLSFILVWYSILAIGRCFDTEFTDAIDAIADTNFSNGWIVSGIGLLSTLISGIILIVLQFMGIEKNTYNSVISIVLVLGAFFYFVGGCVIAASYNTLDLTSAAGVSFGEGLFVTALISILAVDLIKNTLNTLNLRTLIFLITYAFCSLIIFFSYATLEGGTSSTKAVAAGYFFILVTCILFLLKFTLLKNNAFIIAKSNAVNLILSIILLFFTFVGACGYWGIANDAAGESNYVAYYVSYAFLILEISIFITIDISFGVFIKNRLEKK